MNINEWKWFPSFPFKHRETSSSGLRDWGSSSDNVWKDFGGCARTLDFGGTNWDVPPAWQSSNSVVLEPGVRLHWRFWMILSLCFVQTFMCFFGRFVRCWPETRSFPDAIQVRPPSLLVRSTAKHFEGRSLLPQDMQTSARRGFLKSASERK